MSSRPYWFAPGDRMTYSPHTYWYWDGTKAWYTRTDPQRGEPVLGKATFNPADMLASGFKEIDNPFQPAYLRVQEGL